MAERDGAAHDVQLLNGDAAHAVLLQNRERREHLRRECLVHLEEVDVIEREPRAAERDRDRVRRGDEQLVSGVDRGVRVAGHRRERWLRRAHSSWLFRETAFIAAMRSADSPMVSPVEVSRIPGATGAMSEARTSARLRAFAGRLLACEAAMSARARRGVSVRGTFVSDSLPPATTTSAFPPAMWSAALVMATHA